MKTSPYYLTELILSIQNEIQSAVDYISETAPGEGTELGRSSAVMNIENLRVKLPFHVELEQKIANVPDVEPVSIKDFKRNLMSRKGFMVDKGQPGKRAMFSKVKIVSLNQVSAEESISAMGEIEITFSPLRRD